LFRFGLVDITVPMLSTCVGLVVRITALLFGPTPVASRARSVSPLPEIEPRHTTVVFGNAVAVLVVGVICHLVVLPVGTGSPSTSRRSAASRTMATLKRPFGVPH
jgi:hypothetical protein